MEDCFLSLDVGGSKYIVGLIDRAGRLLGMRRGVWRTLDQDCVLETLLEQARLLLHETGLRPVACGITIPGLADPERGLWVEATFSGIRDFPICAQLTQALGMPAYCENDGQAYALGEQVFGSCRGVQDFIYMNVSNGIGGALVSGGRLITGAHGHAGEPGHCCAVPGGRLCKCGSRGCLEMHAAGPGIALNYREAGGEPEEDGQMASAKTIAARARNGEALAKEIFVHEGELLGGVLAVAINLLNPARVVLGGGVAQAYDLFGPSLEQTVRERIYRGANPDVSIGPTPLGELAGLYSGAAIALLREENSGKDGTKA